MIELFETDIRTNDRLSSKGNQLKWCNNENWYKADYTGYEGLAEYMVSHLLKASDLDADKYILYQTEEMSYKQVRINGCSSKNFLKEGMQIITLERLFQTVYAESLNKQVYKIKQVKDRIRFMVEQTVRLTGLQDFGTYLSILLTIDAIFLNEDRHTHNIAVLMDAFGKYQYCPIFDHGAALLSDTSMDYPLTESVESLMQQVKAKTFCPDFDEQLDAAEELYGQNIHFNFTEKGVTALLSEEKYYPFEMKERVKEIVLSQRRKYSYLFRKSFG